MATLSSLRPISVEFGFLSNADGSCRFSQGLFITTCFLTIQKKKILTTESSGNTSVVIGVFGPLDVSASRSNLVESAAVSVQIKPISGKSGPKDRERELFLLESLKNVIVSSAHPSTEISLFVQVINDDGCLEAVALNACTFALIDAGIPMNNVLAAASLALIPVEGKQPELVIDPTARQVEQAESHFTFAFNSSLGGVVGSSCSGSFSQNLFFSALEKTQSIVQEELLPLFRSKISQEYGPAA